MKLRLHGNSLRLRLTRREVERLRADGAVEESVDLGGAALTYRLETAEQCDPVHAELQQSALKISVDKETADGWATSDDVGIYARVGALTVSIEKDFRCLTRPLDDAERDCYPNPAEEVQP
jgi:hypothetical protein